MSEVTSYSFAVLRAVPHVHLGAFANVGVVVHARTLDYLAVRVVTDVEELRRIVPDADVELLSRYLSALQAICDGADNAGPVALAPPSERFHWITAPRSDVIQCSPVHEGVGGDPRQVIDELFATFVHPGPAQGTGHRNW